MHNMEANKRQVFFPFLLVARLAITAKLICMNNYK